MEEKAFAVESHEDTAERSTFKMAVKVMFKAKINVLTIALWQWDHQDVLALSTNCNTSSSMIMKHPKECHDKQPLPCPTAITDYNYYMGGVDLVDQHLGYCSLTTRHKLKWWKKDILEVSGYECGQLLDYLSL